MLTSPGELLALSVAQRGLWVSSKLAPADIVFTIAEAIEIHGAVDTRLFMLALERLANEIEPSRTRLIEEASGPRQRISETFEGECQLLDLAGTEAPFAAAMRWMQAELSRPIGFARDALWASALIRLGPSHYMWYHRCHHVVMDGFSGGLIANRLAILYNAMIAGEEPPACPFGRLATLLEMEAAYRASDRHARDRAYWLEQLADLPAPVSLARTRRAGTGPLLRHTAVLDALLAQRLMSLAREIGGTLPQILIALVAIYVHRVTGAPDLTLGMPVTGRVGHAMRAIPAMVANAVVMRFRFGPDMTLADVVAQSGRNMRAALRHQQFRYEDLRRALGLFHTDQQISWTGVNIEPFDFDLSFGGHPTTAHNLSNGPVEDLTIFIYDRNDDRGLRIDFDANALLYEPEELARHSARLVGLIESVSGEPARPLSQLKLFAAGEREVLLSIRGPKLDGIEDVVDLLSRQAVLRPDAIAVRGPTGALTYRALLDEAGLIAAALGRAGIGDGDLVAVATDRDAGMVATLLGILSAGAAFLPLDPDGPPERARMILDDARPSAVLAPDAMAEGLGFPVCLDARVRLHTTRSDGLPARRLPGRTAYVIYTSGSTGIPKGVVVPRAALDNLLAGMDAALGLGKDVRLLAVTTLGFDISILELLLPLRHGGQVVVATRTDVLDPRGLAALIAETGVTAIQATPSLWNVILAAGQAEALRGLTLMTGGEALSPHLARRLHGLAGRLVNLYGPTETTIWSMLAVIGADDLDHPPIGRPLANQHVYVLDAEGEPAPIGVVGELCIGGAGVATGYLDRAELTAARFVADPYSTAAGARIYRTGDRASVRPDGTIDYLGRSDDQVKVRGVRLEPGETEAVLAGVPGVAQAVVVLRQDGSEPRLCGYLVAQPGVDLVIDDVRRAVTRRLPDAAIPTAWAILGALPLNANGKLDRRALPAPEFANRAGYVAPRTPDEELLAGLWSELFNIEKVGVHDNFFALGGDSLIAAQLIAELSTRSGAELPLGAMFEDATLESLAAQLGQARSGVAGGHDPLAELLPIRSMGRAPPLFCIHPVSGLAWGYSGLIRHIDQDRPIYGLQSFGITGAGGSGGTLRGLAAHYLRLIREVQPAGPFHLLGFSFGGLVAHEIARQCEQAGDAVAFLGLLDAYPYRPASGGGVDAETIMHEEEGELVRSALAFLGLHPEALGPQAGMDELVNHLVEVYDVNGRRAPAEIGDPEQLVARLRAVTEANLALARAHRPGVVGADVLFVRASERGEGAASQYLDDRPQAWSAYLTGRLDETEVACRHQDMLDVRSLESIGPLIAESLRSEGQRRA